MRGINKAQKPPLGKLRPLPEKERRTMFFSSPIDLNKWNSAGWKGMLYLFYPGYVPVLGLLYRNYSASKEIFNEWKKLSKGEEFADEFLKVDYLVPPFPNECWVYTSKERNYGKGYFVFIGPNVDKSINRAITSGIKQEELLLTTVSRYQWMDEMNGSYNRDMFKSLTVNKTGYYLMPIGIKNENKPIKEENLIIDFSYAIKMKNVTFKNGDQIKGNDFCKIVLRNPENNA
ncbi:hypothetical protein [Sedimentibacter saalensis]|nr:hypothetical protein [Sedimentibacter saalensis]